MYGERVGPATRIDESDAPNGMRADGYESLHRFYKRLGLWNGEWNGSWQDHNQADQKDRRRLFEAIASSLELTDYQEKRSWLVFQSLPDNFHQAYSTTLLILVVAARVCKEDGRYFHPSREAERNDDVFRSLLDETNLTDKQFRKCYQRVDKASDP